MPSEFQSVEEMRTSLGDVGYLAGESTALVAYLAARLGKPVLVEGPAGVGKTELAKALSRATERKLIRLQCYEGLDEAKALYEWNYRKQLLRIQTEARDAGWEEVQEDIFGEEFLLSRPLLSAIASEEPVVLLIDEIDKTDQEFEAMLLEVLSDFQISIPEMGVVEARSQPIVVLTSNNSRELTEALKRRCLYLWLDYPDVERELEIVRLHAPELSETLARKLVEVVHMVRNLDLKKPPSIAESIDWARALLLLGAEDIDRSVFEHTMSIIVKHRTDLDVVAERVGVKLTDGLIGRAGRSGVRPSTAACPTRARRASPRACSSSPTRCAARAWRWAPPSCSTRSRRSSEVPWTEQEDFREALAATLAKSQEDRRIFELVFDRYFFRAVERRPWSGASARSATRAASASTSTSCASAIRQAIREGSDGEMRDMARLAIAAFGRQGEGSGVIGVDVQRIRRTLGLRGERPPDPQRTEEPDPDAVPRERLREFERHLRRELERALIERTQSLPPAKPLREFDRALPSGPAAGPRRGAPRGGAAQAPARHAPARACAGTAARGSWTCAARCAPRSRPAACRCACATGPRRPRRPELYVLCDVSTSVTSASVFFLSVLHALHDSFRKLRSFVFVERISEVTDVFERERSFKAVSHAIATDAGVADVSGYTDYGRVWLEFLGEVIDDLDPRSTVIVLGDARTNGREPHAQAFARVAERAGRTFWLNPEPRLYWNYGDSVMAGVRALLRRRVRVLDHQAARDVRERTHLAAPGLVGLGDRAAGRVAAAHAGSRPGEARHVACRRERAGPCAAAHEQRPAPERPCAISERVGAEALLRQRSDSPITSRPAPDGGLDDALAPRLGHDRLGRDAGVLLHEQAGVAEQPRARACPPRSGRRRRAA